MVYGRALRGARQGIFEELKGYGREELYKTRKLLVCWRRACVGHRVDVYRVCRAESCQGELGPNYEES